MLDRRAYVVVFASFAMAVFGCSGGDTEPSQTPGNGNTGGTGGGGSAPGTNEGAGKEPTGTYEAPAGASCVELGDYSYTVKLDLPDGDPQHCLFGTMNKNLFSGEVALPPLRNEDVERKECTSAELAAPACNVEGTRCNWLKTSTVLQDGQGGTKIGKVTTTTGVKVHSATSFSFVGSEHHVLNDGTDIFPKCSWVVTGTKK